MTSGYIYQQELRLNRYFRPTDFGRFLPTLEWLLSPDSNNGLDPLHMTSQEKIEVVHVLQEKGVFKMKGAVAEAARELQVSEPTIYRYLHL